MGEQKATLWCSLVRHQSILNDFQRLIKHETWNRIRLPLLRTFSWVTSQPRTRDSLDCGGRSGGAVKITLRAWKMGGA
jgi:hypothetical protein